ncbi:MAG: EamA family transporter [Anaerostipes sp.]|nr:EamA family transporter [Anaerostipes sp.]
MRVRKKKGICLVVLAGLCWGLSGVTGKYLFTKKELTAVWLVALRLTAGGGVILAFCWSRQRQKILDIWKQKNTVTDLLIVGIFGLAACQLTYFLAIQYSNPGIATVLHYLAPAMILLFCMAAEKRKPAVLEICVLLMMTAGVFILATQGSPEHLAVTKRALLFGIASAVFLSVYNLQPKKLLDRFSPFVIVGWGMLIGGLVLSAFTNVCSVPGRWDSETAVLVVGIVIYGTIIPFCCYLQGVAFIGPVKASMYSCIEPLTAALLSVILLGQSFGGADCLGMACIIAGITALAVFEKR